MKKLNALLYFIYLFILINEKVVIVLFLILENIKHYFFYISLPPHMRFSLSKMKCVHVFLTSKTEPFFSLLLLLLFSRQCAIFFLQVMQGPKIKRKD